MSLKLEKLKILIVEDIEPIKELIVMIIETLGLKQIHTVSNGDEALDVFYMLIMILLLLIGICQKALELI